MPKFDRLERQAIMEEVPAESLEVLRNRLSGTNRDLTLPQADLLYDAAKYVQERPDAFPEFADDMDFIARVVAMAEDKK